jgi:hypothetical protein
MFLELLIAIIGRYQEIERGNRILLEKMAGIMHGLKNHKLFIPPSKLSRNVLTSSCRAKWHASETCAAPTAISIANLPGKPSVSEATLGKAEHL